MNTPTLDTKVLQAISARNITDVLHFTTNRGLTGIAATRRVLSRANLNEDEDVPFVYTPNCASRTKDLAWIDYVNLSISRVNKAMLDTSNNWHRHEDLWWLVLVMDPQVLAHPGVQFVTTNNTYSAALRRAPGVAGLEDMFSDRVPWGHYGSVRNRPSSHPDYWTTDPQAEALYPGAVSVEYVKAIYVPQAELADEVHMLIAVLEGFPQVPIEHRPEVFA